jgi:hypothetical protein
MRRWTAVIAILAGGALASGMALLPAQAADFSAGSPSASIRAASSNDHYPKNHNYYALPAAADLLRGIYRAVGIKR